MKTILNREELIKKDFTDVIAFVMSEPGAMGPNDVCFYEKSGKSFTVDYLSEETPYHLLKERFPVLNDCYFNGPKRNDIAAIFTIVIGKTNPDKSTHIAEGWSHKYLDFGNHLVVKEEIYKSVINILKDKDNCDITFRFDKYLKEAGFINEKVDMAEEEYLIHRGLDIILAQEVEGTLQNMELIAKIDENNEDLDGLLEILSEYKGRKITVTDLKQYGSRRG